MNFVMLKFFRAETGLRLENRHFPKTVRFRGGGAHKGRFTGRHPSREAFYRDLRLLKVDFLGG